MIYINDGNVYGICISDVGRRAARRCATGVGRAVSFVAIRMLVAYDVHLTFNLSISAHGEGSRL